MKKLIAYMQKKKQQRIVFDQLSAMTNRELQDIGLGRSEIYNIAYGPNS